MTDLIRKSDALAAIQEYAVQKVGAFQHPTLKGAADAIAAIPARGVGERGDAKEVAKLLAEFIDATLRRNTERDGNWGYPSFHDETRDISARLEAIITTEERK